jgi:hypothetical protein
MSYTTPKFGFQMKAHYQALIASAFLFLSADKALEVMQNVFGSSVAELIYFVIAVLGIVTLFLGLVLLMTGVPDLLPFPLLGQERYQFEQAHPEAASLSRRKRVQLYNRWKAESEANHRT